MSDRIDELAETVYGTTAEITAITAAFSTTVGVGQRFFNTTTGNGGYWNGTSVVYDVINGAANIADQPFATLIVVSGGVTYIAEAVPGSLATAAVWRCQSVDSSGNVLWADGNAEFDNTPGAAGASLSGLSYS